MLFKDSLPALMEVKPEYDARLAIFHEELQASINFYNTIVINVARKFHPLTTQIIQQCKLDVSVNDFSFRNQPEAVSRTPNYVFVKPDGTIVHVPVWKLSRNSWAIASDVRRQVRAMQRKQAYDEAQTARSKLTQLKGNLTRAKRELEQAESVMDRADKVLQVKVDRSVDKMRSRRKVS